MPYNFVAESIHTKELCSRLFKNAILYRKRRFVYILRMRFASFFRAEYDVYLRLIGNHVVDFILVLIELFPYLLRPRSCERISIENRRFNSNRVSLAQNSMYGVALHQPFFLSENQDE